MEIQLIRHQSPEAVLGHGSGTPRLPQMLKDDGDNLQMLTSVQRQLVQKSLQTHAFEAKIRAKDKDDEHATTANEVLQQALRVHAASVASLYIDGSSPSDGFRHRMPKRSLGRLQYEDLTRLPQHLTERLPTEGITFNDNSNQTHIQLHPGQRPSPPDSPQPPESSPTPQVERSGGIYSSHSRFSSNAIWCAGSPQAPTASRRTSPPTASHRAGSCPRRNGGHQLLRRTGNARAVTGCSSSSKLLPSRLPPASYSSGEDRSAAKGRQPSPGGHGPGDADVPAGSAVVNRTDEGLRRADQMLQVFRASHGLSHHHVSSALPHILRPLPPPQQTSLPLPSSTCAFSAAAKVLPGAFNSGSPSSPQVKPRLITYASDAHGRIAAAANGTGYQSRHMTPQASMAFSVAQGALTNSTVSSRNLGAAAGLHLGGALPRQLVQRHNSPRESSLRGSVSSLIPPPAEEQVLQSVHDFGSGELVGTRTSMPSLTFHFSNLPRQPPPQPPWLANRGATIRPGVHVSETGDGSGLSPRVGHSLRPTFASGDGTTSAQLDTVLLPRSPPPHRDAGPALPTTRGYIAAVSDVAHVELYGKPMRAESESDTKDGSGDSGGSGKEPSGLPSAPLKSSTERLFTCVSRSTTRQVAQQQWNTTFITPLRSSESAFTVAACGASPYAAPGLTNCNAPQPQPPQRSPSGSLHKGSLRRDQSAVATAALREATNVLSSEQPAAVHSLGGAAAGGVGGSCLSPQGSQMRLAVVQENGPTLAADLRRRHTTSASGAARGGGGGVAGAGGS